MGLAYLVAVLLLLAGTPLYSETVMDESKLVDLTYALDENTVYWPTGKPFEWRKEEWGMTAEGYWYAAANFSASEHLGTHLDSPIHFGKDQLTADQIPLSKLVGKAVVLDVTSACNRDADYRLTSSDIHAWEDRHGHIPGGAIVFVRTGWSKFWPDRKRYLGSDKDGDTANLHFPGISADAASILVERKIHGVGIDTASIDHGPSTDFPVHRILNGAGIYALENVANLEQLPPTGASVFALPMKIKGGSGAPVRILAILP